MQKFAISHLIRANFLTLFILLCTSCASYDQFKRQADDFEIPTLVVNADKGRTWAAVVSTMKRYDIDQQNMDSGVIRTKWMDNTLALNFTDSFGTTDKIKSAKFKLLINVATASANKQYPQTKITIYKRQLVENDMFQGWREIDTDSITEKTLLYRIQRVVAMDTIIAKLQKEKESRLIKNFEQQETNGNQQQLTPDIQQPIPETQPAPTESLPESTPSEIDEFPEI